MKHNLDVVYSRSGVLGNEMLKVTSGLGSLIATKIV